MVDESKGYLWILSPLYSGFKLHSAILCLFEVLLHLIIGGLSERVLLLQDQFGAL
jgi:hypothetical protein